VDSKIEREALPAFIAASIVAMQPFNEPDRRMRLPMLRELDMALQLASAGECSIAWALFDDISRRCSRQST
jgi:hypothetical protein